MTLNRQAIREEFDREMTTARDRVMANPDGEAGWLVNFIQLDLEALAPSEWMVKAYEVASFAEAEGPGKHSIPIAVASGWSVQVIPGEPLDYTLPNRKEAIQLQRTIRSHLEQMWQHGIASVTFSDFTVVVTMPGVFHDRHGSLLVATKPKAKEFEYRVAVLLAKHAGRIRACEECQRIFVAARRDQLFCHPRCQMRVASRKWRKQTSKQGKGQGRPVKEGKVASRVRRIRPM